jgi:predicted NAD/FAD-dependent oxidoreductase
LLVPLSSDIEGRRSSEAGTVDYVMPEGSSSIVKHFFQKSGIKIQFDHFVENIQLQDNKWNVATKVCSIKTLKLLLL